MERECLDKAHRRAAARLRGELDAVHQRVHDRQASSPRRVGFGHRAGQRGRVEASTGVDDPDDAALVVHVQAYL